MLTRSVCLAILLFATAVLRVGTAPAETHSYPAMPAAVSSFGAIECDGYLYIYGGHAGKTHHYDTKSALGTFHRLKLAGGKKWEELPSGPIAQGLNLAAYRGKVYRVGGMEPKNAPGAPADLHSLADCARFDPRAGKWERLPALPAGRSSHDVVVAGEQLVVVGGWDMKGKGQESVWHDTALLLDLKAAKPQWKSIPQPFKRRSLAVAAVGTKVYVLGGLTPGGVEKRVDILDVATGKWSEGPELPGSERGAFAPAACTVNGRIILNTLTGPVYRLTAKGDGWDKVGGAATKRLVARLVPLGSDRVILLGGATTAGNADSLEAIQLKPVAGEK